MICPASKKDSARTATATPIVNPRASSAHIATTRLPRYGSARFTAGHLGNNASVKLTAKAARAASGAAVKPGIGTQMKAPETRASTSTNRETVGSEKVR